MASLQSFEQPDLFGELQTHHVITGFNLAIGNNYTLAHFFDFMREQNPDILDALASVCTLDATICFEYKGSYGFHVETVSGSDFFDYMRV